MPELNIKVINDTLDFCIKYFVDLFGDCSEDEKESLLVSVYDFMVEKIAETTEQDPEKLHREILDALDNA